MDAQKAYAIVTAGGKQYKVQKGDVVEVDKINLEAGSKIDLDVVMSVDGGNISTEKKSAKAEVVAHGKGAKIVVFKYKAKKNVRKKQGHRQQYTKIKILEI